MKEYSAIEYLAIDLANAYGLDKKNFEDRIEWVKGNLPHLEIFYNSAENKPLYRKALIALRKVQQGKPTGHLVGLDSSASGLQLMSVVTGCVSGATATGLVNPNKRADAYSELTEIMNSILSEHGYEEISVSRKDAKQALMTALYGSKATPRSIFGEKTPELYAFYMAQDKLAPGATWMLNILLKGWDKTAMEYSWVMPDGFNVYCPVMDTVDSRIEVEELGKHQFTFRFSVNKPIPKGVSLPANVTHSLDSYVLRQMHRMANYDVEKVDSVKRVLYNSRFIHASSITNTFLDKYIELYEDTGMVDMVIVDHITKENAWGLSNTHVQELLKLLESLGESFELVTIHDEFKCHPNHANQMRKNYITILVNLAKSDVLTHIIKQVVKVPEDFVAPKFSDNLAELIEQSNYGIC